MTTPGRMSREWPGIPYSDLAGRLCAILLTQLTLLHQITTFSTPLGNHLRGKSFTNAAGLRQELTNFFASKTPEFYRKGIAQLETRWQKVLDADGAYFED